MSLKGTTSSFFTPYSTCKLLYHRNVRAAFQPKNIYEAWKTNLKHDAARWVCVWTTAWEYISWLWRLEKKGQHQIGHLNNEARMGCEAKVFSRSISCKHVLDTNFQFDHTSILLQRWLSFRPQIVIFCNREFLFFRTV